MYLGRFHIEAPLYTTDNVSENNCDQTEINNRQFKIHPCKNLNNAKLLMPPYSFGPVRGLSMRPCVRYVTYSQERLEIVS